MNIQRAELCFVAMAIGDLPDHNVTEEELRETYETVIRAALLQAKPSLEVKRSDEVANPGVITGDILTNLMQAEYAVFDITYPNPNVFYELGIRHCCGLPSIIIRDAEADRQAPFDVRQQRYIEYEDSKRGIQKLADALEDRFDWYENNPDAADNPVLKHASRINFSFPEFVGDDETEKAEAFGNLLAMVVEDENMREALIQEVPEDKRPFVRPLIENADRDQIQRLMENLTTLGVIDFEDMTQMA